ncbi:MAG: flavodoxin family protein [Planctomycetia bacterium]
MNTPRCLILLESVHHGNTAKVAEAMGQVLKADIVAPDEVPYTSLANYAAVGFGSGVYYGQMHHALTDWLAGLPDAACATAPAFIFSTSGLPFLAKIWTAPLRRLLARKGFDVVGEFACRGFDTWGPLWLTGGLNRKHPDERDLARAAEFARRIVRATRAPPASQSASAA